MLGKILGALLSSNVTLGALSSARVSNAGDEVFPPPAKVSFNMPAFREQSEVVEASLKSLHGQNIVLEYPESFEFVYVGVEGDPFDREMVERYADKILLAEKRGKLHARDMAIRNSSGELIAAVDLDSIYPPNWTNTMLRPFRLMENVTASTASTKLSAPVELLGYLGKHFYYNNVILGRGSIFRKEIYLDMGGFDLSVEEDYTPDKLLPLWMEEEHDFKKRLEEYGEVVYVDAPMFHFYNDYPIGRGLRKEPPRGKRA